MKNFFNMIQSLLQNNISLEQKKSVFDEFQILDNECIYVIDFNDNKLLYKKGIKKVLGYTDDEMNLPLLFETYHPDDKEIISKVIRESILHTIKDPSHGTKNTLYLKYRRKRKDGTFITVLSQSHVYDLDTDGKRMKWITRLTDVSFANDFTNFCYSFQAHNLDKVAFDRKIHEAYVDLFTEREYDVIEEMYNGASNREISNNLYISEHTVATHRKNILRKSACHNVNELIVFCKANGVLGLKKSES